MKYIKISDNGNIKCLKKPIPKNKPNSAVIRVAYSGICGSDMTKIFSDEKSRKKINSNILGHEFSGIIHNIKNNRKFKVGDRVAIQPLIFNRLNEIVSAKSLGKDLDGGFSEYCVVPISNLIKVPKSIPLDVVSLTEIVATCVHAINFINLNKKSRILIIGDGAIGLSMAIILKSLCEEVYMKGKNFSNLSIAKGLKIKLFKKEDKGKFDYIFEAVGRRQNLTLSESIEHIAPNGEIIVLGVFVKNYINKINLRELFFKEASMKGSNCYNGDKEFIEALRILEKHQKKFKKLVTHKIAIQDFSEIKTILKNKDKEAVIKIMIDMGLN